MNPDQVAPVAVESELHDQKIAKRSLNLLFYISLFHAIWLTLKNYTHISSSIINISHKEYVAAYEASIIYLIFFTFIIILNFIPLIRVSGLNKKELYKKQIRVSIISFIIFQAILHILLYLFERLIGPGSMMC